MYVWNASPRCGNLCVRISVVSIWCLLPLEVSSWEMCRGHLERRSATDFSCRADLSSRRAVGGSWEALFLVFFFIEKRSTAVGTKTNSEPPGGRTLRTSTSTYTPISLMVQVEANWLRRQMKHALFCSSFGSRSEETSARVCLMHLRFLPDTCRLHGVADCRALQPLEYNLW